MFLGESITSTLERLSSPRIAATSALASLFLLIVSFPLLIILKLDQLHAIDLSSKAALTEVLHILFDGGSKTGTAIVVFSIVLVFSCCGLVIELIRLVKNSSKILNEQFGQRLKRESRRYRLQLIRDPTSKRTKNTLTALEAGVFITTFSAIFFDVIFWLVFILVVVMVLTIVCYALLVRFA